MGRAHRLGRELITAQPKPDGCERDEGENVGCVFLISSSDCSMRCRGVAFGQITPTCQTSMSALPPDTVAWAVRSQVRFEPLCEPSMRKA